MYLYSIAIINSLDGNLSNKIIVVIFVKACEYKHVRQHNLLLKSPFSHISHVLLVAMIYASKFNV